MRRWHLGMLAALLVISLTGSGWAQTTDVPPDHWAYRAVQTLVERGYMDTAPGGLFNGTEPAQRYDLAAAVGRLLEDIEAGRVRIGSGADTELLRALEQEFRAELVQWYSERDRLEEAYAQTQRRLATIDEQLGRLLLALDELHDVLRAELAAGLAAEAGRTDDLVDQARRRTDDLFDEVQRHADEQAAEAVRRAEDLFARAEQRADGLDARVDDLDGRFLAFVDGTNSRVGALADDIDERVNELRDFVEFALGQYGSVVGAQFDEQIGQLTSLRSALESLQTTVERHDDELADLDLRLNNYISDQAAALAMRLEMTERNVQLLTDDLTSLSQVLTMAQRSTEEDVAALRSRLVEMAAAVDGELSRLTGRVAAMQAEMAVLQSELADLHDVLGTSEEQIARMTERVRMQLDDQLALSLSRERQLERQLNELRAEFEGYKAQAEEEMKAARNMGSLALGAAALAILLGLMN